MHLFNKIHLPEVDPLGGGLAEEIAAEQADAVRITLDDTIDASELTQEWEEIVDDARQDPDWFSFSEE